MGYEEKFIKSHIYNRYKKNPKYNLVKEKMEFILFLSKIDKEIIGLINKSNHSIEENTALCLIDKKYVGFFKKSEKLG